MTDHLEAIREICYKHFGHEWEVTEADIFYDIEHLVKRVETEALDRAAVAIYDSPVGKDYAAYNSGLIRALKEKK
jgi:hypothetical protein